MKKMFKTGLSVIVFVIIGYLIYDNYYFIINKIDQVTMKYFKHEQKQDLKDNSYRKKTNYEYLKVNNNTDIKNYGDLKNAIYTYLDAGWNTYNILCNSNYVNCIDDAKEIIQNNSYLTDISNFVHPYNTFKKVNATFTSSGKITLNRKNKYTNEQISQINSKIDEIYNNNYNPNASLKENIKIFHDYIVNNTTYDKNNTSGDSSIPSSTAYGVLFNGSGICSGYTDTMALFLEKLKVPNYRVSSPSHVWNLAYVDNSWLHIDLTWDDPVTSDNSNVISDKYFLISTSELKSLNDGEHEFDDNIYIEAK